jgi:hypothetical protein
MKPEDFEAVQKDMENDHYFQEIIKWGFYTIYVFPPSYENIVEHGVPRQTRFALPEIFAMSDPWGNSLIIPVIADCGHSLSQRLALFGFFQHEENDSHNIFADACTHPPYIFGMDVPSFIRKFIARNPYIIAVTFKTHAPEPSCDDHGVLERLEMMNIELPAYVDIINFIPILQPQWKRGDLFSFSTAILLRESQHPNVKMDENISFRLPMKNEVVECELDRSKIPVIKQRMTFLNTLVWLCVTQVTKLEKTGDQTPVFPHMRSVFLFFLNIPSLEFLKSKCDFPVTRSGSDPKKPFRTVLQCFEGWKDDDSVKNAPPPWYGSYFRVRPLFESVGLEPWKLQTVRKNESQAEKIPLFRNIQDHVHLMDFDKYTYCLNINLLPIEKRGSEAMFLKGRSFEALEKIGRNTLDVIDLFCCLCNRCGGCHHHMECDVSEPVHCEYPPLQWRKSCNQGLSCT